MYILMDVRNINCTSSTRSNNDRFILFWIIPSASRSSEKIIIQILVRKWWSEKRWPLEKRDRIVTMCGLDHHRRHLIFLSQKHLIFIIVWIRKIYFTYYFEFVKSSRPASGSIIVTTRYGTTRMKAKK